MIMATGIAKKANRIMIMKKNQIHFLMNMLMISMKMKNILTMTILILTPKVMEAEKIIISTVIHHIENISGIITHQFQL